MASGGLGAHQLLAVRSACFPSDSEPFHALPSSSERFHTLPLNFPVYGRALICSFEISFDVQTDRSLLIPSTSTVRQDPRNLIWRAVGSPDKFTQILGDLPVEFRPCPIFFGPDLTFACQIDL